MRALKTYNFWIRLVAVLILLLRVVGDRLGFYVDSELYMDIATALASVLVILGVIQVPAATSGTEKENKEGNMVREDIAKTLKEIGEKIKGITDSFVSGKLAGVSGVIDEILFEGGEQTDGEVCEVEKSKASEMADETVVDDIKADAEEEVVIESEKDEALDDYLLRTENIETSEEGEGFEESEAAETQSSRAEVFEEEIEIDDELILKLKSKIKSIIDSNIDEILASVF